MKRTVCVILAVLALASCSRGRIIPDNALEDIYCDMLLSDQWLKNRFTQSRVADTTLFYEAVFRAHGYTYKDYDATLKKKLQDCEDFAALMERVRKRLVCSADYLSGIQAWNDSISRRNSSIENSRRDSVYIDFFKTDTLINYCKDYVSGFEIAGKKI